MEIAAATVGSVLPKLQAYLLLKHDGDHDDADFLCQELTSIHAALRDAATRGHASPGQPRDNEQEGRAWAGVARELAYDIDDAIDALLVTSSLQPARRQDGGDDLPCSLEGLLQRATDLSGSHPRIIAGEVPVPPATVMHLDLDDEVVLVGADGARDGLIRRLHQRGDGNSDGGEVDACDRKVKAVAIVRSMGLGKTALARLAYGVLQPQFDCAAFVFVGFHPHIESVLQSLLR